MDIAYNLGMPRGRPSKSPRSDFGERLRQLRIQSGLSQQEVADQLGIGQPSYADWERRNVSMTADQIRNLADVFSVPIEELFKTKDEPLQRTGPVGRARTLLTEVADLPRARQKQVLNMVESLVSAYKIKTDPQ